MINNNITFQHIEHDLWGVSDNDGGGIGTIALADTEYSFRPIFYHKYNADSLLIISRYLNKLNKQGLDILR
jgi:hypothetical protein